MPYIKNVSSQGDLDLPLLGRVIKFGETVEVTADQFEQLKSQPDVWAVANVKENRE